MPRIHRLPPAVIQRIAAGEVIDRPAAVVKELLENALDAGARTITIQIDGGGLDQIVVADDGHGIPADDLPLAVERHATSKIATAADLARLKTLGFRGEALAAIGTAAHLTIESRPAVAPLGARLTVRVGTLSPISPCARQPGMHVTVTHLFAGLPARRRHLKTPAAEAAAAEAVAAAHAVLHPDVAIAVWVDGRWRWGTPGSGDARAALAAVYGDAWAAAALPLHGSLLGGAVTLTGFLVPPDAPGLGRRPQVVGCNGRPIHAPAVAAVVQRALGGVRTPGPRPGFWIALTCPPDWVDPNVHPAKATVRWHQERAVLALAHQAVRDALARAVGPRPAPPPAPLPPGPPALPPAAQVQPAWLAPPPTASSLPWTPLGQWAQRYLVAVSADTLLLLDQHAAHERVLFDQLQAAGTTRQPLLVPVPLDLDPVGRAALETARPVLAAAGFTLTPPDAASPALLAIPAGLGGPAPDWAAALTALLRDPVPDAARAAAPVAATLACRAAVKAGRRLAPAEQAALLAAWAATTDPATCPHGRPTAWRLPLAAADRAVRRRVASRLEAEIG